ncbi:MAG: hypothetical protein NT080_12805 [Spirochaetes bacterium]|nr:hypothetical protein [Spirochaetota bacterium]
MRSAYVRRENRKRGIFAWGGTAVAYLLAIVFIMVAGLLFPKALADSAGPIRVRLGSPTGVEDYRAPSEAPEAGTAMPAPASSVPAAATTAPSTTTPAPAATTPPSAPKPATPAAPTTPAPAIPVPGPSQPAASTPVQEKPNVVKGSEAGNRHELAFEAGSGIVGRTLYVPIYLYMPLPGSISPAIVSRMPKTKNMSGEEIDAPFLAWYDRSGDGWTKKPNVTIPFPQRPRLWQLLKDSGYDLLRADYRLSNPGPMTINFQVSIASGSSNPFVTDLAIKRSSGYSELDEAVLFGFAQAGFRNSSDKAERGTFTYDFGSGK